MPGPGQKATRREWVGLAVIALPCLLYAADMTVLNLAVPALSAALEPTAAQLLWIIDIYGFMVAGSLITMGTLGDRIGRRRLLMIGAAAFACASVLAAMATRAETLIAARALLGVAGATVAPSTLSLIRHMFFDERERRVAIGLWVASYSAGAALGPLIGGVLIQGFGWSSVFLIAVPVMALLLALGPRLLPEYRDPQAGRLDLASAALSLAAVLSGIYGLKHLAERGPDGIAAACIAASMAFGVVFARRQRRLADPLIDLRLFASARFNAALLSYLLGCFTMMGLYLFIAQYLQLVLGLSPLQAGVWTVPSALAFVVGSLATPPLARRFKPVDLVTAALALATLAFVLLAQVGIGDSPVAVIGASSLLSLGLAPVFTLATDLIVGAAPPERAGAAAAIAETGSELGAALGVAIFGSIGTAVYRSRLAQTPAEGLSRETWEAARSTLGAATAEAAQWPAAQGLRLIEAAREAFVSGMQFNALVAAAVMLATTLAMAIMRGRLGIPDTAVPESPHPDAGSGLRRGDSP